MGCYLGLDIGTTGIKAVIFDESGAELGIGRAEYKLETPAPGIVELEPERYWLSVCEAVAAAVAAAGIIPGELRSVAVTGQAETLIMVGADGTPLRKAIVWLDNRATEEARLIEHEFGAETLFRFSGQTEMLPAWPAAKLLWLRRHEPELFTRCAGFLMVEDYIILRLTGRRATCRGLLPSSLYYDIRSGSYFRPMLEFLGLDEARLPELRDPGTVIGVCIPNAAGIPAGIPVAAAPIDHVCGNLGSGGAEPGVISETTGAALALCAGFPELVYDEKRRISTYLGWAPGRFALLPWAPTAGLLLKCFRDEFACGLSYPELDAEAATIAPGSDGLLLLPHCAGAVSPVSNPLARGVACGITLAHRRGHWVRAIMEAVACLLRDNVEVLRGFGIGVREVRSLGGASRSRLWLQIKADVLQLPVAVAACDEATALGAAILAATACGDAPDAATAAAGMVRPAVRIFPGENALTYREVFRRYQNLNELMLPTFGGAK